GLGRTALIKHNIEIGDSKPVKQRHYPVSPAVEKLMFSEIDRMLRLGVIEPSQSAWSSPMRMVVKPNKVRLCLDARKLNEATRKDAYPLQSIEDTGEERPLAFMSKKLSKAQRNYSVTERECLAVILAVEKFRCYLELQPFEVVTDHSSLLWLMRQQNVSGRLARWILRLQAFKFTISHRKGKDHVVPDALSRISEAEIDSVEWIGPEIDLDSPAFLEAEYVELKDLVDANTEKFPDLKAVDKYVYIRT
ncbi:hypothetical protein KR215_011743, partial [Drosophila sulfurigaster]